MEVTFAYRDERVFAVRAKLAHFLALACHIAATGCYTDTVPPVEGRHPRSVEAAEDVVARAALPRLSRVVRTEHPREHGN